MEKYIDDKYIIMCILTLGEVTDGGKLQIYSGKKYVHQIKYFLR